MINWPDLTFPPINLYSTPCMENEMHIVREIKKYNEVLVANAMYAIGYSYDNPKNRPTNITKMVEGIPRCDLLKILEELKQ